MSDVANEALDREDLSQVMLAVGFEDAFVGLALRFGWSAPVAVYDRRKCLGILMDGGMDYISAVDAFESSTLGAWVGQRTPVFIERCTVEQIRCARESR